MNNQEEEYAANGGLLKEQEYGDAARMSVDDVSTTSTGGGTIVDWTRLEWVLY